MKEGIELEQGELDLSVAFEEELLRAAKRIEDRVAMVLAHCQRFESIAKEFRHVPDGMDIDVAAAVLDFPGSGIFETEKALVLLALKSTVESGQLINSYTPPSNSTHLDEFRTIAKIEWQKRYARCH